MLSYLELLDYTIRGELKENRTGVPAYTVAFQHFEHDMELGFPLLTTKKMPLRTIAVELEGFIKGITSKEWYQKRNCYIWREWANPRAAKLKFEYNKEMSGSPGLLNDTDDVHKVFQELCDDLGPIYGYQWRHFGTCYDEDDDAPINGFDQFNNIVETLKTNPDDRRMVCSAWNPNQITRMALPPCHLLWNLVHIDGVLYLHWHQRSCDLMLGVPFNIASYALLLLLLCKEANLKPGILSATFGDCHIYKNHMKKAFEQLGRDPYPLPKVEITGNKSIFDWTHEDIKLTGYQYHDKISLPVAV